MEPGVSPQIDFHPFKTGILEACLALPQPLFVKREQAYRQLHYVEKYAADLGCQCVVVESRYIDRDYMEDHSVFYSKSLHPYQNFCRRLHFFVDKHEAIKAQLDQLVEQGIAKGLTAFREACLAFSRSQYLGFCVFKPLPGSPIGRTVMRPFPEEPTTAKDFKRCFDCVRSYTVHLLGAELTVKGLAFQQQDVGVSACATTAMWSALQKIRDHEDIATVTPAQITALASRYSLPFGRSMPSEGLSIDQMCQAIQALGVSPSLFRVERMAEARGYLFSAIKSGFAPVLVLRKGSGSHAVAVAGMKVRVPHVPEAVVSEIDDVACDLLALYVHDDRRGPYLRANLEPKDDRPHLVIPSRTEGDAEPEAWTLTHILVPMHPKIRLALSGLTECAIDIVTTLHRLRETVNKTRPRTIPDASISFDRWILRSHKYIESLFVGVPAALANRVSEACRRINFSRYVGVVRVSSAYLDPIDILIDTTSTLKNAHCVGVVAPSRSLRWTVHFAETLSRLYRCPLVT